MYSGVIGDQAAVHLVHGDRKRQVVLPELTANRSMSCSFSDTEGLIRGTFIWYTRYTEPGVLV